MAQDENASSTPETPLWTGNPSHVIYLTTYVLCGLTFWLILPLFVMLYRYLLIRTTNYEITSERLRIGRGIFSRSTEQLELYRVKDFSVEQPFFQRLFGVGSIVLVTSDKTNTTVRIEAVKDPEALADILRTRVESLRRELGVRELDR